MDSTNFLVPFNIFPISNILLQSDSESMTESKIDKQKSDDPVVDLFPEDENEERSSKYWLQSHCTVSSAVLMRKKLDSSSINFGHQYCM